MESLSNLFLEKKISSFFSASERPAFLVVQLLPLEVAEYSAAEKRRQAAYLGVVVLLSAPPNHSLEAPPVPAATPYLVVVVEAEAAVSFSSQQLPLGVVEGQAPPSLVVEAPPSNPRQEYSVAAAAVEPPCLAALRSGLPVRQYLVAGVAPLHLVGVSRPLAAAVEQPHWAVECSVVPLGQEFLGPAQPLRLPLDRLEAVARQLLPDSQALPCLGSPPANNNRSRPPPDFLASCNNSRRRPVWEAPAAACLGVGRRRPVGRQSLEGPPGRLAALFLGPALRSQASRCLVRARRTSLEAARRHPSEPNPYLESR